jgi:hypothetical protein
MKLTRPALFMTVVSFVVLVGAVSVADARQTQSQGQTQQGQGQAKPDSKPESKPEASLTGKWNVNVQGPNGAIESGLDLKVDGKKVTGTISSPQGEAKIEGELAEGKLTFWFSMDANGQTLNISFTGSQQKDGTLAGTLSFGQGELTWTAARAKN